MRNLIPGCFVFAILLTLMFTQNANGIFFGTPSNNCYRNNQCRYGICRKVTNPGCVVGSKYSPFALSVYTCIDKLIGHCHHPASNPDIYFLNFKTYSDAYSGEEVAHNAVQDNALNVHVIITVLLINSALDTLVKLDVTSTTQMENGSSVVFKKIHNFSEKIIRCNQRDIRKMRVYMFSQWPLE